MFENFNVRQKWTICQFWPIFDLIFDINVCIFFKHFTGLDSKMNENDEIEGKESGIKIVMHDFESVFPKDDPSVIGNFINSMSVGL